MGYVETLFGHQAPVLALDTLMRETAVSVGGRDKSVRFWKVPEETQLVFGGGGKSGWEDILARGGKRVRAVADVGGAHAAESLCDRSCHAPIRLGDRRR